MLSRRFPSLEFRRSKAVHISANGFATRPVGTGETKQDTSDAWLGLDLVSDMRRNPGDGEDARRMAHNPEVEGSNPSPRYQGQRPFLEQRKGLLHVVC